MPTTVPDKSSNDDPIIGSAETILLFLEIENLQVINFFLGGGFCSFSKDIFFWFTEAKWRRDISVERLRIGEKEGY